MSDNVLLLRDELPLELLRDGSYGALVFPREYFAISNQIFVYVVEDVFSEGLREIPNELLLLHPLLVVPLQVKVLLDSRLQ